MAANFNQTNKNQSRYFFATTEEGEQDLTTQTIPSGNFTDFYVGITGSGGNQVQINQMVDIIGTNSVGGEGMVYFGTNSAYETLSTLGGANAAGGSLSIDRVAGSGVTSIESYGTNGSLKGFEFLSRGVGAELLSTTSVGINQYMSSINRPSATMVLGATGTLLTGGVQASVVQSLDLQTGPGGKGCFTIFDLSGAGGLTPQERWAIGTRDIPTGSDVGSDLTIYRYGDAGNFLGADIAIRRSDGAMSIQNISSVQTYVRTGSQVPVYPASKTNVEFGGGVVAIAGSTSNQALYGNTFAPLFSTAMTGLNPNGKTFLSINFENSLSSGSNHVNYKIGFSTATAYTNTLQTSYVPGGQFTPSDVPSATTPIGYTLVTGALDPDGIQSDGTGTLYVSGQISDPSAAADQLFIAKGAVTESTRYALTWRPL